MFRHSNAHSLTHMSNASNAKRHICDIKIATSACTYVSKRQSDLAISRGFIKIKSEFTVFPRFDLSTSLRLFFCVASFWPWQLT